MEIGATIARVMRSTGVSQAEMARRSGVPARTLRAIIRGDVSPKLCQVCSLADALGMECWRLVRAAEIVAKRGDSD